MHHPASQCTIQLSGAVKAVLLNLVRMTIILNIMRGNVFRCTNHRGGQTTLSFAFFSCLFLYNWGFAAFLLSDGVAKTTAKCFLTCNIGNASRPEAVPSA